MKTTDRFSSLNTGSRTTGIGSLPHHNVDAALHYCFKFGIPFLPQIPIRNSWEYMIAQALEGLPGLQLEEEGQVFLNWDIWQSESHRLEKRLTEAFAKGPGDPAAFEGFEPSPSLSSCWQPFLWELQERNCKVAKVQIAGPLTCQWSLRLKDHSPADRHSELGTQIFRLILARALALVKRMLANGVQPIVFLDEPGLYALALSQPKHVVALQELKLTIQTLRKEGAIVGMHCCSNTLWEPILKLGIDILSLDTQLSLNQALSAGEGKPMIEYVNGGGRLALGVIPTTRSSVISSLNSKEIWNGVVEIFAANWGQDSERIQRVLKEALFTPACGLALHSTSDAELVLEKLIEVYESFDFQ